VTLGPIIDGLRVIRDGLQPDNWVIVNGIQRVKAGTKVEPIKQGLADHQPSAAPAPERTAQRGGR